MCPYNNNNDNSVKCEYENDEDEDESGTDETMDVNSLIDEEEEQNDYPLEGIAHKCSFFLLFF